VPAASASASARTPGSSCPRISSRLALLLWLLLLLLLLLVPVLLLVL
jgi:hypothetical protein